MFWSIESMVAKHGCLLPNGPAPTAYISDNSNFSDFNNLMHF